MHVALDNGARPELRYWPGADMQPVRLVSERAQVHWGMMLQQQMMCRAFRSSAGNLPVVHARIQGVSFIAVPSTASEAGFLYDTTIKLSVMAEIRSRYVDTTSALTLYRTGKKI